MTNESGSGIDSRSIWVPANNLRIEEENVEPIPEFPRTVAYEYTCGKLAEVSPFEDT
ncbi:hypothetical protein V2I01_14215 [Micromonospora sp. BRA006-A]|nr:hypothetical protein [Micromonospora sp. BRA006-A]